MNVMKTPKGSFKDHTGKSEVREHISLRIEPHIKAIVRERYGTVQAFFDNALKFFVGSLVPINKKSKE